MIIPNFLEFFFFKSKTETANLFWKPKALVEDQSRCRLCTIKSHNKKEYASDTFDKFCEVGIEHQLLIPYTPQPKVVSERKKIYRNIMENGNLYATWEGFFPEVVGRGCMHYYAFAKWAAN